MSIAYTVKHVVPYNAPDEYKRHALESARREMGNKLYNAIYSSKLPATVDIVEEIVETPKFNRHYFHSMYGEYEYLEFPPEDSITITAYITPVQNRNVVMYVPHSDYKATWSVKQSFMSKWIRKLFHRH